MREKGVSSNIGVILLVAIVVIMFAIGGMLLLDVFQQDAPGDYGTTVDFEQHSDGRVTVTATEYSNPVVVFVNDQEYGVIDSALKSLEVTNVSNGDTLNVYTESEDQLLQTYTVQAGDTWVLTIENLDNPSTEQTRFYRPIGGQITKQDMNNNLVSGNWNGNLELLQDGGQEWTEEELTGYDNVELFVLNNLENIQGSETGSYDQVLRNSPMINVEATVKYELPVEKVGEALPPKENRYSDGEYYKDWPGKEIRLTNRDKIIVDQLGEPPGPFFYLVPGNSYSKYTYDITSDVPTGLHELYFHFWFRYYHGNYGRGNCPSIPGRAKPIYEASSTINLGDTRNTNLGRLSGLTCEYAGFYGNGVPQIVDVVIENSQGQVKTRKNIIYDSIASSEGQGSLIANIKNGDRVYYEVWFWDNWNDYYWLPPKIRSYRPDCLEIKWDKCRALRSQAREVLTGQFNNGFVRIPEMNAYSDLDNINSDYSNTYTHDEIGQLSVESNIENWEIEWNGDFGPLNPQVKDGSKVSEFSTSETFQTSKPVETEKSKYLGSYSIWSSSSPEEDCDDLDKYNDGRLSSWSWGGTTYYTCYYITEDYVQRSPLKAYNMPEFQNITLTADNNYTSNIEIEALVRASVTRDSGVTIDMEGQTVKQRVNSTQTREISVTATESEIENAVVSLKGAEVTITANNRRTGKTITIYDGS